MSTNNKQLQVGENSIPIEALDLHGNAFNLEAFKGTKVLITFIRSTSCIYCLARYKALKRRAKKLQDKGIRLVFVVAATKEEILKNVELEENEIIVIPDPEQKVYGDYGIEISEDIMPKFWKSPMLVLKTTFEPKVSGDSDLNNMPSLLPVNIIIDENQKMERIHYGKYLGDHIPIDEI